MPSTRNRSTKPGFVTCWNSSVGSGIPLFRGFFLGGSAVFLGTGDKEVESELANDDRDFLLAIPASRLSIHDLTYLTVEQMTMMIGD